MSRLLHELDAVVQDNRKRLQATPVWTPCCRNEQFDLRTCFHSLLELAWDLGMKAKRGDDLLFTSGKTSLEEVSLDRVVCNDHMAFAGCKNIYSLYIALKNSRLADTIHTHEKLFGAQRLEDLTQNLATDLIHHDKYRWPRRYEPASVHRFYRNGEPFYRISSGNHRISLAKVVAAALNLDGIKVRVMVSGEYPIDLALVRKHEKKIRRARIALHSGQLTVAPDGDQFRLCIYHPPSWFDTLRLRFNDKMEVYGPFDKDDLKSLASAIFSSRI